MAERADTESRTADAGDEDRPAELHGPLTGIRVLELGALVAGSFAGRLLADLGAEVIKIEASDKPDPLREWGNHRHRGRALWWPVQARNKKCTTINLREQEGQALFLELVAKSDAVLENFRPGTLEGWNLSYDTLAQANPGVVLVRISGYGQNGPYAGRAGFAAAAEAMSGLRYLNGYPGEPPPRFGISLGDSLAGMFAAQGLLAALYERDALGSGRGQVVDVSLVESCFALLESVIPEYDLLGEVREPSGSRLEGLAPSNVFESADGARIVIAANQDSVFQRLCVAMGQPDLAGDARFATHVARGEHQEEIEAIVAEWARARPAREIDTLLNEAGVVCSPIYSSEDIFRDPHFRVREMLVAHDDPELGTFIGPGVIPKFSRTPGGVRWTGRARSGSDNDEVFGTLLGRSRDELEHLHASGVI